MHVKAFLGSIGDVGNVTLVSFSNRVLTCWAELDLPYGVEPLHFTKPRRPSVFPMTPVGTRVLAVPAPRGASAPHVWSYVPGLEESVTALRSILDQVGGRGIRQTALRHQLMVIDGRFATKQPGQITALVTEAERRGLLSRVGDPSNPLLKPLPHEARIEEAALPVPRAEAGIDQIDVSDVDGKRLSDLMEEHLHSEKMGPYVKARRGIYRVMEEVPPGPDETVSDFIGRIVDAGLAAEGVSTSQSFGVRMFIENLFRRSRILADLDGNPLGVSLSTLSRPIGMLVPDWRLRCESELLLCLARRFRITSVTRKDAAFVLFNDGREGMKEVERIITSLIDSGRAEETDDGGLRVVGSNEA
jgi:hypothetical protein